MAPPTLFEYRRQLRDYLRAQAREDLDADRSGSKAFYLLEHIHLVMSAENGRTRVGGDTLGHGASSASEVTMAARKTTKRSTGARTRSRTTSAKRGRTTTTAKRSAAGRKGAAARAGGKRGSKPESKTNAPMA